MAKAKTAQLALLPDGEIGDAPSAPVQSCYDLWNRFAKKNGWQEAKVLDTGRRAALKRACKDYGGVSGFQAMLEKIERSDWCMGRISPRDGRKQFKADLDWFTRPVTVRKVIEDFYNGAVAAGPNSAVGGLPPDSGDPWLRWVPGYLRGGFWPLHLGPRPEEPGCRATPSLLMDWRRENNVSVTVAPAETREQRLAHTISRLRGMGQHERANRYEAELAALEGKPAAFVPNPSVADANKPSEAKTGPAVDPRMGHNGPPGPITDLEDTGDPGWTEIPEGDESQAEA